MNVVVRPDLIEKFGDSFKEKEYQLSLKIDSNKPYFAVRIDGRGFSKFTKRMKFKQDSFLNKELSETMMETTKLLMENWQASIGYTQSDEITLIFKTERKQFDGKVQKLVSLIAAQTSVLFNKILSDKLSENKETNAFRLGVMNAIFPLLPIFDCRVIELDDEKDVVDILNWRLQDEVRNSILNLGYFNFNQKELHKLNCKSVQQKLLTGKNIDWNKLSNYEKYGCFFIRKQVVINEGTDREAVRNKIFRDEELELLQLIQLSEAETKTDVVSEKLKLFLI